MTHPASVTPNQPQKDDPDLLHVCGEPGSSGSADDGNSGRIVAVNGSVDPEQIERSELCQREVDQLVVEIIAKTRRLDELMGAFRNSLIPLQISETQRYRLMNSGCYLTTLYTRNEHNL